MNNLENYLDVFGKLINKINSEKLVIYRIRDSGLHGISYLFLTSEKGEMNIKNYLISKNDEDLGNLIQKSDHTIQIFNDPLEKENLNSENLNKLISIGFVQVRTNKLFNYFKKPKDYPDSEKIDKR